MSRAASRYAPALLSAARDAGLADAVERDLSVLRNLIADSPELADFLAHPLIPSATQQETLDRLFAGKLQPLTLQFLKLLAEKGRLADTAAVVEEAWNRLREARGVLCVGVVTAVPLTPAQEKALSEKLAARTGKTIEMSVTVDPALIGGFRLRIGDRVEDYSLATKLETFKQRIINA